MRTKPVLGIHGRVGIAPRAMQVKAKCTYNVQTSCNTGAAARLLEQVREAHHRRDSATEVGALVRHLVA
jgi:hypothetical protein